MSSRWGSRREVASAASVRSWAESPYKTEAHKGHREPWPVSVLGRSREGYSRVDGERAPMACLAAQLKWGWAACDLEIFQILLLEGICHSLLLGLSGGRGDKP